MNDEIRNRLILAATIAEMAKAVESANESYFSYEQTAISATIDIPTTGDKLTIDGNRATFGRLLDLLQQVRL